MPKPVTESQFYMWRTIFALAHADAVVKQEELSYMAEVMADIPFSDDQLAVLRKDSAAPQCVDAMFEKVTDIPDQVAFFKFARELVYIDGEFVSEEQAVMLRIRQFHLHDVDVSKLVGRIYLELEDEQSDVHAFRPAVDVCRKDFLCRLKE